MIRSQILQILEGPSFGEYWNPGGALNFFSGRGVRPGFLKCGACELTFASEKGGL